MADFPALSERKSGPHPGPRLDGPETIRLISLMPGDDRDHVICDLLSAELSDAPPYEALSYTWGDPSDVANVSVRIPVAGSSAKLSVTSSCMGALRRLRLKDQPRTLWIDAMCIDQSNVPERNHQVTLMSRIYSQATRVVIYLGEAAHGSDSAVDFLLENHSPTEGVVYVQTPDLLQSLNYFFLRPWFTRVWILQEVLLSQDAIIYCGNKTLPWDAIKTFNQWNVTERWLVQLPFVVSASMKAERDYGVVRSLLKVLSNGRHCKASNPRDKVYALLSLQGFYDADMPLALEPNYADSVTQVFTTCAASLLQTDEFNVLSAAQGHSNLPILPSWVPDWSLPLKRCVLSEYGTRPYHSCSMQKAWSPTFDINHDVGGDWDKPPTTHHLWTHEIHLPQDQLHLSLQTKGFLAGRITALGSTYIAGSTPFPLREWSTLINNPTITSIDRTEDVPINDRAYPTNYVFERLLSVAGFANSGLSSYLYGEHYQDLDYTPPLNYNKWISGRYDGPKANPQDRFSQLIRETGDRLRATGSLGEGEAVGYADIPFHRAAKEIGPSPGAYVRYVLQHCHERKFFVTDTGYMGLAPSEAEIGDEVYLFVGAGFPFILRETGQISREEGRLHRLVGEGHIETRPWVVAREKPRDEAETITII